MGSLNCVHLIGNLGRDAELRYTPGGTPVSTLNMATTETWTDKAGQRQEQTEWHRVTVWSKMAESLDAYLKKGKQIYVQGRLQTRKWQDKDGNDRWTTEIKADRIQLLGGARSDGEGGGGGRRRQRDTTPEQDGGAQPGYEDGGAQQPAGEPVSELTDDDIPF